MSWGPSSRGDGETRTEEGEERWGDRGKRSEVPESMDTDGVPDTRGRDPSMRVGGRRQTEWD